MNKYKIKIILRRLTVIFVTVVFSLLYSCSQEEGGSTTPNDNVGGNKPSKPSFYQIRAIVQEPDRGMYLSIYDASDNENGFIIERKTTGGSFTFLVDLPANTEYYEDWGLGTAITYTYRIKAYNQYGSSDWSEKAQTSAGEDIGSVFFYPSDDSYVYQMSSNGNYGTDNYLLVDGAYDNPGYQQISYLKFDFQQNIPAYATGIKEAELRFLCQNEPSNGSTLVTVHKIYSNWNENNITWNSRPGVENVSSTLGTYVNNDGSLVYFDIKSIVEDWLEGSYQNFGFALIAKNSTNKAVLYSKERSQGKPILTVEYYW